MKQRIAITGGRGRLAAVAAACFRQQEDEVVLFSRKGGEGFQALEELFIPAVLSSFSVVIHAAWSTVPFTSEADPGREEREDFPLLEKLLKSFHQIENEASVPRLIFLSSASVYGNQKSEPATEQALCAPLGGYARGKLFAEHLILQAAAQDPRLHPIILRITNLVGMPSNSAVPQGIVSKMMEAAKDSKEFELWGDGNSSKDYLWFEDFLEALKATVDAPIQGIFNIGSETNFSICELIKIVEGINGQPLSIKYHPHYSWDVSYSKISSQAFMQATGWKPRFDLVEKMRGLIL